MAGRAARHILFNATTGALLHILSNPDPAHGDAMGNAVAVSGNVVVVGATLDNNTSASDVGSAYVFDAMTGANKPTGASPASPCSIS